MADLDVGWSVSTTFPDQPLPQAELDSHLDAARSELLDWNDPRSARLGFAMSAPSEVAIATLQEFLPLNPNNVGHHARFGEGKTGTRRLEKEALAALGGLLHGGSLDGYITSGATEAAIASLRIGRNALRAANARRIRVLAGDLCHHSLVKSAEVLDVEFRAVPSGRDWVIDLDAFKRAVAEAVDEGCDGIIVGATAGYYNSGLCDPVAAMAEHTRTLGVQHAGRLHFYVHVDAAHGGLIFPFTNPELAFDFRNPGVHAIAVDPHKSGGMPYSCGVLLTRKGLFEHATHVDRNTLIVDETLLGSRSGATAAALWAVLHAHGRSGYAALTADCMRKRDLIRDVVAAADPDAEVVAAPDAPVLSVAFTVGQLPPWLCERYRLVPIALTSRTGDRRLFYHCYAGASLSTEQIEQFGRALAAGLREVEVTDRADIAGAVAVGVPQQMREHADPTVATVRSETDCFRHFVVHPAGRRDPGMEGYSFHTFVMRRATGEPIRCEQRGRARSGGPLHVFAPDLSRPFANELFGVATRQYSLEILDRHQQELSLVGAVHASVPLRERDMRVLLNFEGDGRLRSLEYKALGGELTDEIQILVDRVLFKIGKSAAGFRRPRSDDYSFSIDTSVEVRLDVVDGHAPPTVMLMRQSADVLLPRRRHLRREQFRRFPNRFFDLEIELRVGREWQGHADLLSLPGAAAAGQPTLALSALLGRCVIELEIANGRATVTARSLERAEPAVRKLSAAWCRPSAIFATMPFLDVREPELLTIERVIEHAEDVYDRFTEHGLPEFAAHWFIVGGPIE